MGPLAYLITPVCLYHTKKNLTSLVSVSPMSTAFMHLQSTVIVIPSVYDLNLYQ